MARGGLEPLLTRVRACRLCHGALPLGARPVVRVSALARLLVISQAPGTKVHASGLPFDDASGDRLRGWMGIDRDTFYDIAKLAFMPMGFCYPGRLAQGGDAPPRPECAPLWHEALLAQMPRIELILLVGGYAQRRYLGAGNVTETVRGQNGGGRFLALPHPSWRTGGWERRNPWFGAEILPWLKTEVARLTGPG